MMQGPLPLARDTGLPAEALHKILTVIRLYPAVERVWLFGSRAKGNFRPGSDIDLCVEGPKLSVQERFALESALDDLLLPWRLDLIVRHEIDNPALGAHIDRCGIPLDLSDVC